MDNFYTQSFQDFAAGVKPLDLALYAGAGLVVWVLFQDKLIGLKDSLTKLVSQIPIKLPKSTTNTPIVGNNKVSTNDPFFQLVISWKQTRDLAVQNGCSEAVKVADQMFPLLGPNICKKDAAKELVT